MKKIRNILCSMIAAFGLMAVCAMPAQADSLTFDGSVIFVDSGPGAFGLAEGDDVSGFAEWNPLLLDFSNPFQQLFDFTALSFEIGLVDFVADPSFFSASLIFEFGNLVGFGGIIFEGLGFEFSLGLFGAEVTADDFGNGGITQVTALFDLPDPDPKVVPEPGTFALLGIGLLGLGVARRRRTLKI